MDYKGQPVAHSLAQATEAGQGDWTLRDPGHGRGVATPKWRSIDLAGALGGLQASALDLEWETYVQNCFNSKLSMSLAFLIYQVGIPPPRDCL